MEEGLFAHGRVLPHKDYVGDDNPDGIVAWWMSKPNPHHEGMRILRVHLNILSEFRGPRQFEPGWNFREGRAIVSCISTQTRRPFRAFHVFRIRPAQIHFAVLDCNYPTENSVTFKSVACMKAPCQDYFNDVPVNPLRYLFPNSIQFPCYKHANAKLLTTFPKTRPSYAWDGHPLIGVLTEHLLDGFVAFWHIFLPISVGLAAAATGQRGEG